MTGGLKLTAKQERFVEEYVKDNNATQAAIRAGYKEKTARVIAAQNLSKLNIQNAIAKQREKISKQVEYDTAAWRKDLLKYKENFETLIPRKDELGEIEVDANGKPIKKVNDPKALMQTMDMLGKHLGAYSKDDSNKDGMDRLADAIMRRDPDK